MLIANPNICPLDSTPSCDIPTRKHRDGVPPLTILSDDELLKSEATSFSFPFFSFERTELIQRVPQGCRRRRLLLLLLLLRKAINHATE